MQKNLTSQKFSFVHQPKWVCNWNEWGLVLKKVRQIRLWIVRCCVLIPRYYRVQSLPCYPIPSLALVHFFGNHVSPVLISDYCFPLTITHLAGHCHLDCQSLIHCPISWPGWLPGKDKPCNFLFVSFWIMVSFILCWACWGWHPNSYQGCAGDIAYPFSMPLAR